jgi:hypothetical protein
MNKTFRYGNRRAGVAKTNIGERLDRRNSEQETFSGLVQGIKASDLEERTARSLSKMELGFEFRFRISSALQGKQKLSRQFLNDTGEVEIDFIVSANGGTTPIFIDGQIGHFFTDYQADKDAVKTNVTNEFGESMGWRPSVRVPFWKLTDQDLADKTFREMFSGEYVVTTEGTITTNAGAVVNTNSGSGYAWMPSGNTVEPITNTRILRQNKYLASIGAL